MIFFNTLTTTALATLFLASMPSAHAMDQNDASWGHQTMCGPKFTSNFQKPLVPYVDPRTEAETLQANKEWWDETQKKYTSQEIINMSLPYFEIDVTPEQGLEIAKLNSTSPLQNDPLNDLSISRFGLGPNPHDKTPDLSASCLNF